MGISRDEFSRDLVNNDWREDTSDGLPKRAGKMEHQRTRTLLGLLIPLLTCIGMLITSGCTTSGRQWFRNGFKLGPDYHRPGVPLASGWIDAPTDPRLLEETIDLSGWWHQFQDPTLDQLIEQAWNQNLTLRQAGTRIQQADSLRRIAVGKQFPQTQQAIGDYTRIRTSENVALPAPIRHFDQLNLGLQASWELDFWGRFRRGIEVADASLDASIAAFDDITVLLLSNVAATYVEIRTLQQQLEIVETSVGLQEGSRDIAQARFEANQTNKLDVIQAQNNIDLTKAAIPLLESQLRVAQNRLCVLLGVPPRELLTEFPEAPIPAASRFVRAGIPADLLRRRPDIRLAESLLRAQSARIGISEAELYPKISLFGSFEWQAEKQEDLFRPGSVFALIGPGFSWNILNYGRLINGVELERERFQESVFNYQQSVLTAQQEVEDAIVGFLKEQDRADQLAEAVSEINQAEQIALTLYETGATDFNRVYLIQSVQLSQKNDLIASRASITLNLIRIYRALGGGWQIRCPGNSGMSPQFFDDEVDREPDEEMQPRSGDEENAEVQQAEQKESTLERKDESEAPESKSRTRQDAEQRLQQLQDGTRKKSDEKPDDDLDRRLRELKNRNLPDGPRARKPPQA